LTRGACTDKRRGEAVSRTPYGLRRAGKGYEPDPATWPAVAQVLEQRATGASCQAIATALNDATVPTASGHGRWHAPSISKLCRNPWIRDTSFLDPQTLYDLIVRTVRAEGVAPGHVLLHGFSQGSHEVFGLTQLDRAGARIVGLTLAESGGTRDTTPVASLAGSRWVLYCAGRDQYAYLTGCGRMRQSAAFLRASGARVDRFLVNPTGRHGNLLYDPPLVESALADFATILAGR